MANIKTVKHRPFDLLPLSNGPAMEVFAEAAKQLERPDVYVDAGTLLGIRRDGKLIPYDTDIDFAVLCYGDRPHDVARLRGWDLVRSVTSGKLVMQQAYAKDGVIVDLYYFWRQDSEVHAINQTEEGIMRVPLGLVEPVRFVDFQGIQITIPRKTDEYLEWRYGPDWRIPTGEKGRWTNQAACLERT
jgi:hypothetical protein